MGVLDWCSQHCYDFLNNDLDAFIKHYVDPNQSKEFHRPCLNYQRTFQKSFMKTISSEKTYDKLKGFMGEMDHHTYFLCAKFCS